MEARDTPAQFYWCPDEYPSAWDKNDWRTEPSATSPIPAQPPTSGDVLYFTNLASNADCPLIPLPSWWNPDGSPGGTVPQVGNFYGVQLTDSYSGVVDFRCSAFVLGLSVGSPVGTVRQSDPNFSTHGGQITVQMGFSWTGGTLNDGPLPGFLNLAPMAQGTIAPTNRGTVNTKSTVTLFGHPFAPIGSTLTVKPGTINLNDGNGFIVENRSNINFVLEVGEGEPVGEVRITDKRVKDQLVTPGADGQVTIKMGAYADVKAVGRTAATATTQAPLVLENTQGGDALFTNLGNTTIEGYCTVKTVQAATATGGGFEQKKAAAGDPKPVTKLQAGGRIECGGKGGVFIRDGDLKITDLDGVTDQPEVVISSGDPANSGLKMNQNTVLYVSTVGYQTLRVKGRFYTQGEMRMQISRTSTSATRSSSKALRASTATRPSSPSPGTPTGRCRRRGPSGSWSKSRARTI